jgi:hypothetical protein
MEKDIFTGQPIDFQAKYESLMSEYLSLVNEHNTLKTRIKSLAADVTGVWGEEIVGCTPEEALSAIEKICRH